MALIDPIQCCANVVRIGKPIAARQTCSARRSKRDDMRLVAPHATASNSVLCRR